jgi:hypothetical protein
MACDPCLKAILDSNPTLKTQYNKALDDIAGEIDLSFLTGKVDALRSHLDKLKKARDEGIALKTDCDEILEGLNQAWIDAGEPPCGSLTSVQGLLTGVSFVLNLGFVLDLKLALEIEGLTFLLEGTPEGPGGIPPAIPGLEAPVNALKAFIESALSFKCE